ncbi:MAG: hypothetical protein M3Q73_00805 [bacterium]|nr:hypothetical protein [bacterium]
MELKGSEAEPFKIKGLRNDKDDSHPDMGLSEEVRKTILEEVSDAREIEGKQNMTQEEEERISHIRQSLNDPSPEGRFQELAERGKWLREFAERVKTAPESIEEDEKGFLIQYIEKLKFNASRENNQKIDALIENLLAESPESKNGNALYERAALGFADQYKRLAERERLAQEGYTRDERKAQTAYGAKPVQTTPMTAGDLLKRKVTKKSGGWFSRIKNRIQEEVEKFTERMK